MSSLLRPNPTKIIPFILVSVLSAASPAMRQVLYLMEGTYLQERRPMGSFFICMDATGW
jgi:hypothetical protein